MSKLPLRFFWLFFCELAFRFIAPFVCLLALPFLKKANMDEIKGNIPYGVGTDVQRYVFPDWLDCIDTQDDYFPACIYENSIKKMQSRFGSIFTGWYNISFRNVGSGLMWQLAAPVSDYWVHLSDEEKESKGLFDNDYSLGRVVLKVGYVTYRDWRSKMTNKGFVACPRITLRIKEKELG
jgi:hypothetical protein